MIAPRRAPWPSEILEYHEHRVEALRVLSGRFEEVSEDSKSPFSGYRRQAFDMALEVLRAELDQQVVLMLVASIEAVVRDDYAARLLDPAKTAVHERFRILDKRYADKVPLEEILDVWKDEVQIPEEVGMLKQIYHYRHWLAHGWNFTDKSGVQAYPQEQQKRRRGVRRGRPATNPRLPAPLRTRARFERTTGNGIQCFILDALMPHLDGGQPHLRSMRPRRGHRGHRRRPCRAPRAPRSTLPGFVTS